MKTLLEQVTNLDERADEQLDTLGLVERNEWLNHPCTAAFILRLAAEELDIAAHWAEGDFTKESAAETAQLNAKELGRCQAYGEMRNWFEMLTAEPDTDEEEFDHD